MSKGVEDRELVLSREIRFPRELVWKAMTEAEHVNKWWGPDGFKNENVSMDFVVGGKWTYEMVGPDGARYPNEVVFKEVEPPAKLVFDHGDGQSIWFETTATLEQTEAGTLVTWRLLFPDQQSRDDVVEKSGAIEGGKQHLANMDNYIKENLQKV